MDNKHKQKEFVEKATTIHNNFYNYSKVEYVDSKTPVTIICPIHGEFQQLTNVHLSGKGCKLCANERRKTKLRYTTEKFIEKANKIHNNKYNYSKVEYKGCYVNVEIICPEHGSFLQSPANHLSGQGCPKCKQLTIANKLRKNQEYCLTKLKEVFGDTYDYSKVCIICPEHGEFYTKPNDLYNGHGCPQCGKKYNNTELFIYDRLKQKFGEENVLYQHTFSFLKGKTCNQTIDFYLPQYNIAIEYQGRQHFEPVKQFGGEEGYVKNIARDKRKYEKCKQNNINMLYITTIPNPPQEYLNTIFTNVDDLIMYIKEQKQI